MSGLLTYYKLIARICSWVGIVAIVILSVVPAEDRPVTGSGQTLEHSGAFALVALAFAIGYRLSLARLLLLAFLFCGGIELLQVPLPSRHARFSDFVIDFAASALAMCAVSAARTVFDRRLAAPVRRNSSAS
jgi:hypothetical protein